ncbi:unnamed protein product [Caenorhabditis sp. 36 PRJEB53466]|nr:unnamed protein product [Caenorhabditis sp. 36 PRJEB53466]
MYITDGRSEPILLAIFYLKSRGVESAYEWIYSGVQVLEGLLIVVCGGFLIFTVYMALYTKLFHFNITIIFSVFMLHWFELLASKLLLTPYQEGFVPLNVSDPRPGCLLHYTFDEDVIHVADLKSVVPMLVGAGARIRYMLLVCFALPCIAVERCCATWHVTDYEQKKRGYISAAPILLSEILATLGAWATTYQIVSPLFLAVTAALLQTFSYVCFRSIESFTKRYETKCQNNASFYSLSVKFQLTENFRSLKVIHVVIVHVAVMIITVAVTIVLAWLNLISAELIVLVFVGIEKFMHVNPMFICTAVFCVQPHWLTKFIRLLPGRHNRTHVAAKYSQEHTTGRRHFSPRHSLADLHFEQLKKLW